MDSNRQLSQPARTSSPDPVYAHDKPQWEHDEGAPTDVEKTKRRQYLFSEYYSQPPIDLTKDGAEVCMYEWLDLAPDHAHLPSLQTRQLVESVDSLETSLNTISYLARRCHSRSRILSLSSESSASASSSSSSSLPSAGAPSLVDAVEAQARGLRRLFHLVSHEVGAEVEEALREQS